MRLRLEKEGHSETEGKSEDETEGKSEDACEYPVIGFSAPRPPLAYGSSYHAANPTPHHTSSGADIPADVTWCAEPERPRSLTPRQAQCLLMAAQGFGYREIGHVLGIASRTVRGHMLASAARLGATSLVNAVWTARRQLEAGTA